MNTNRLNLMRVTMFSLALITGLIFCCRTSLAQDREQLQAIWRKKVEESTQFFNLFKSHVTGRIATHTATVLLNGERQTVKSQGVTKRKGSFYVSTSEALSARLMSGDSHCYGINSKYAFKLKKAKNGKDWVVQNVVEVTPDFDGQNLGDTMSGVDAATWEKVEGGFRGRVNHSFDRNFLAMRVIAENGVLGYPRPVDPWNVEELPGFLLHSISTDGQSPERIQLNFEYQVEDPQRKKIGVANCQVDFVLEPICYPVKSHQVMKKGDEETILDWSNEVKENSEKKYEAKYFSRLKKTKNAVVTKFVELEEEAAFSLDDPPESDFTLSAFGLPEPPGIEWKKPFPWYLVFAIIGTVCLGVFFFLRARGRRLRGS